jgi:hypothetical protein
VVPKTAGSAVTAPSLFDPTGDVAAERAAIANSPRSGTWFADPGADGRWLTQEHTEALIRAELLSLRVVN